MKFSSIWLPEAQGDLREAVSYYREVAPDSVLKLRKELDDIRLQIESFPYSYQAFDDSIRRAPLRHFPYFLYYQVDGFMIVIAALLPQRFGSETIQRKLSG
jgi:plasmid stabilization system protein ParE